MTSLSFDLTETVNQVIAGAATVGAVFIGAKLAIRGGLIQVRHERLLDRRLVMLEGTCDKLDDYVTALHVLLRVEAESTADRGIQRELADNALRYATDTGRELQAASRKARLYGDARLIDLAQRIFHVQLDTYMASWSTAAGRASPADRREKVEAQVQTLEAIAHEARNHLRSELGLDALPDAAGARSRQPPAP